ncbi:UNVERIFIED_CONTAM: hypothetical protein FKN15_001197 [Acipenser sinensis]
MTKQRTAWASMENSAVTVAVRSWLELGNKQRATAATGMNDRSSRSHLVFTLVVTQTKTELVEEEEHDHMITSRINLVIVTGSKRCSAAQTSGDRLEKAGITFKVDNLLPNLVNLNEDPQLSEMLLYMIREGRPNVISNVAGTVSLTHSLTYVNGILVFDSTVLHHGDRIFLGGDHYF